MTNDDKKTDTAKDDTWDEYLDQMGVNDTEREQARRWLEKHFPNGPAWAKEN